LWFKGINKVFVLRWLTQKQKTQAVQPESEYQPYCRCNEKF